MHTCKRPAEPIVVREVAANTQDQYSPAMSVDRTAATRIWVATRDIIRLLVRHHDAYLTDQDLKRLRITCTDLDLNTGKPADGGEVFIRPFSIARIREILERTKPWLYYELLDEKDSMPMIAAMEIMSCLLGCLVHDGDNESTPLFMEAHWNTREYVFHFPIVSTGVENCSTCSSLLKHGLR